MAQRSTRPTSGSRSACCSWRRSSTRAGPSGCCTSTCSSSSALERLAPLLQPRRDHGLGRAHLSRCSATCSRGCSGPACGPAQRAGPARPAGRRSAGWRSWPCSSPRRGSPQRRRLAGDRRRRRGRRRRRPDHRRGRALRGRVLAGLDLRGDVYGPANYLAYVAVRGCVWPWEGEWDEVPAAHAAAIAFDLLVVIGLVALGRRLREGAEGRTLGAGTRVRVGRVPVDALRDERERQRRPRRRSRGLGARRPCLARRPRRRPGARSGAKFGTAALAPLFATAGGLRDRRGIVLFSAAFAIVCLVLFAPFLPDGGPGELYDRTLGYQADRGSPFSLWGLAPSLDFLQDLTRLAAIVLAVALAFVPRTKTPRAGRGAGGRDRRRRPARAPPTGSTSTSSGSCRRTSPRHSRATAAPPEPRAVESARGPRPAATQGA